MAETYCGKNCSECAEYQNSLCPGCRQGPGSWLGNDCDIAQCARDKGCATCLGCDSQKTCILCAGASVMPERRKQRSAAKEAGQALRRQRKDVGKWLWIYFWMLIPSLIVSFMTNNTIVQALPGLKFPGEILGILVGIAECVLLFLLSKEEKIYGYAAWIKVAVAVIGIIMLPVPDDFLAGSQLLSALALIVTMALSAASIYYECEANCIVLTGVKDDALAEKWQKLWKRYWVMVAVLLVGSLVAMMQSVFTAVIGLLAVLVAAIGLIVVGTQRLIYLYKTAALFREP